MSQRIVDPNTPTWRTLRKHIDENIEFCRDHLEGQRTEIDTALWRGQIIALRGLIAAVEKPIASDPTENTTNVAPLY